MCLIIFWESIKSTIRDTRRIDEKYKISGKLYPIQKAIGAI